MVAYVNAIRTKRRGKTTKERRDSWGKTGEGPTVAGMHAGEAAVE
jgi:hypothetical protein